MRVRGLVMVLGILTFPATATADDHRADLFGGPSFAHGSSLWGVHTAYAFMPMPDRQPRFGIVVDYSVHHGEHDGVDVTRNSILGGVRWSLTTGPAGADEPKHTVSVHVLTGVVRTGTVDETDAAVAFGALWEFFPQLDDGAGWGLRAQADFMAAGGDTDGFPRVSVGAVYRFNSFN